MSIKNDFGAPQQILMFPRLFAAISVQLDGTNVKADDHGRKIIPAGTPIGGTAQATQDETAVLAPVTDATVQGVLMHDEDVTENNHGNGSMLIWGFVNLNRIPDVTVPDEVQTALAGKVTFLKRN